MVHPSSRPRSARLRIELGSFELRVPGAPLAGAPTRTTLATLSRDLVDLRARWCAWSSVEFLRAYRVAFLAWLRERAAPGAGESNRRFAALLQELARPDADLLAAFERVYQRPLSATGAPSIEESLEGQFLTWLSRH